MKLTKYFPTDLFAKQRLCYRLQYLIFITPITFPSFGRNRRCFPDKLNSHPCHRALLKTRPIPLQPFLALETSNQYQNLPAVSEMYRYLPGYDKTRGSGCNPRRIRDVPVRFSFLFFHAVLPIQLSLFSFISVFFLTIDVALLLALIFLLYLNT